MKQKEVQSSQVYGSDDISIIYDTHNSEIPKLVKEGVIPPPLPTTKPRSKKRWAKATIHKQLGIKDNNPTPVDGDLITRISESVSNKVIDEILRSLNRKEAKQ